MRPKSFKSNQVIYNQGASSNGCYAVIDGALKVTITSVDGDNTLIAVLSSGDIIGEMGLADGAERSATVTTIKDCKLAFLSSQDFHRFATENPAVYKHMLKVLCERLRNTNDNIAAQQLLPLNKRLARVFLRLSAGFGQPIDNGRILIRQKFTQAELGKMAGGARENVSRQINEWSRDNILSKISSYYCIEKVDILEDLAKL